jgi:hypothetical protein
MSFWVREVAGWLLILLGLFIFYICVQILLSDAPMLLQSGPISLIGIFVFRGGIHLLKVSVAARVAMRMQKVSERRETELAGFGRALADRRRR